MGASSCILSTGTTSFGPACWRKLMPSKDGSALQPRALMLALPVQLLALTDAPHQPTLRFGAALLNARDAP